MNLSSIRQLSEICTLRVMGGVALTLFSFFFLPDVAAAQPTHANPISSLVVLTGISLLPFAVMSMTSFVKISVVLSVLRNAIGIGQVPSGLVIAAISLVLTMYVMAPVGEQMHTAIEPMQDDLALFEGQEVSYRAWFDALDVGKEPLREFMIRNSGDKERSLFFGLANRDKERGVTNEDFIVVFPSFLITELSEAFQIGFLIFLPFLVVDMVVSNILLALGMHMLSPTTVSLPFKLLLFVLVDGWFVLTQSLVLAYA